MSLVSFLDRGCKAALPALSRFLASPIWIEAGSITSRSVGEAHQPLPAKWSIDQLSRHLFTTSGVHSTRGFSTTANYFVTLNKLAPAPGSNKQAIRWGRGTGSGRGKTCGRGHKGQKARKGNGKPGILFDGGQKGLYKFPKHYAKPTNPVNYDVVNITKILHWVDKGKLDAAKVITMQDLRDSGCASKQIKWGVKLLAGGSTTLSRPLHLQVSACSTKARDAIEAAGGTVTTVYYNHLGLKALLKPWSFAKQDKPLPSPVRAVPPRLNGLFDTMGQLPPKTAPPSATA